jgi:23S rRNA (uracil1939-C5)-methyltransferase
MAQASHIITVEKIVPMGFGLGRLADGKVALVRYVLPGERVRIRPVSQKKHYLEAELEEILEPSLHRCQPPCSIFGQCGGCDLQQATDSFQLHIKSALLTESLTRGGCRPDILRKVMQPVRPSPQNLGYRQRIRLHIDDSGVAGFHRYRSNLIVPAATCPLAVFEINDVLKKLSASTAVGALFRLSHSLELLFNPETKQITLLFHYRRQPRPADRLHAEALLEENNSVEQVLFFTEDSGFYGPRDQYKKPSVPPFLQFTLPRTATGISDLVLTWEAGGFCQINLAQNEQLINFLLSWLRSRPPARVLDLYCGMGNFSLPLSLYAREVIGLDGQGSGIRSAKRNVMLNNKRFGAHTGRTHLLNCSFRKTSVPAGVKELVRAQEKFDCILLDPPRQGAAEIISALPALRAETILYISCNPATLARDLALLEKEGYRLEQIQPFDMFPQTHHLETVALLDRISEE